MSGGPADRRTGGRADRRAGGTADLVVSQPVALFETMRVRRGALPFLERHLKRLAKAAEQVGLDLPPGLSQDAVGRARAGPPESVLKVVWDGRRAEWEERDVPGEGPLRVVTVGEAYEAYPVKSIARDVFERAAAEAEQVGADEPLLLTRHGDVAETARFALVWLDGKVLRVPDPALGVLPSVGLARLLELAAARRMSVLAGKFHRSALDGRPAVLVNAVRGVIPVATLDGMQVPVAAAFTELGAEFWPAA
jgi:branched-subunit amino acid aminotransferase/4-amino-4-deoxychorismate lyase